jgi:hypothetical protein
MSEHIGAVVKVAEPLGKEDDSGGRGALGACQVTAATTVRNRRVDGLIGKASSGYEFDREG